MTPSNSNILAFPAKTGLPVVILPLRETIRLKELDTLSSGERAEYVASIVHPVIGFARRKGTGLASLPPQLRTWFLELCDLGDPTCLVILDWLNGNPAFTVSGEGAR